MECKGCPKGIKKNERTYVEKTPDGKLVAVWHLKCWHTHKKRIRWEGQGRTRESVTPYDGVRKTKDDIEREVLRARQAELAQQRALEETPRRFDDWRSEEHERQ